ncbi:MAG: hypothetical protein ACE37K_11630 [Planctomycetota bacterium]
MAAFDGDSGAGEHDTRPHGCARNWIAIAASGGSSPAPGNLKVGTARSPACQSCPILGARRFARTRR